MDVEQVGRGRNLVVLHSLLTDRTAFRHVLPRLSADRRVTLINLPGYGKTPASKDDIAGVAKQIAERLGSVGVTNGFDLMGNGYGGFIAVALAQQYATRVERLLLLDCAAYFPDPGKAALGALKKTVETKGMAGAVGIALQRLFPEEFAKANPAIIEECRKVLLGFDATSFAATCQNLIDADLRAGLPRMTGKTLVVVGEKDLATPPPLAHVLANGIPGARLIEIPGCGHAPHVQMPDRVLSIADEFLGKGE